jgi:hypothetical protein
VEIIDYMVVFYVSTVVFIYLDVPSDINVVKIYIISVHPNTFMYLLF